ncbi:MAG: tetratricopeptide repeat protein [Prevotellaceae bacterium]|jgi:tetratricopeptide (TPR) repeat protein|nr:tetratricopeptide repeat protein [Prevotellaceae bacterium]
MKKLIGTSLLLALTVFSALANSNSKAIEYFKFGLNSAAQKMLEEELNSGKQTPQEKAEVYYYLGEIAFADDQKTAAADNYKKGETSDPTYIYNKIGQTKLQLATNVAAAEKELASISKSNKKDIAVLVAVGRAYLENNLFDKTAKQIADIKNSINLSKPDSKYAQFFVLEGDLRQAEFQKTGVNEKINEAVSAYSQAIYFDKQCKEAYAKYARIINEVNPNAAIAKLNELLKIDPSSHLAYREIGNIYYQQKEYAKAAENYAKYVENDKYSISEFYKYAIILYYKGDYEKSLEVVNKALAVEPNNVELNRYYYYNNIKLKNPASISIAEKYLALPNAKFTANDYVLYANLLKDQKRVDEAIAQYEKALKIDSTEVSVYKDLGDIYKFQQDFNNAVVNYKKYVEKAQAITNDYFLLGQCYYYAAVADAAAADTKALYLKEADSTFALVVEKMPTYHFGNFWRARVQSQLDPESKKALAKPYYEAAAEILGKETPTKYPNDLIECYRYLSSYYANVSDLKNTKLYLNKILEVDPKDAIATKALRDLKK